MIKLIGPKYIALLTVIASVSVIGTGFSSWVLVSPEITPEYINGNINTPEVDGNPIPGLFYVKNSEFFFDYYQMDGNYNFTSSSIGIKLKMDLNTFSNNLPSDSSDIFLNLNLSYSYSSSTDLDIFAQDNEYLIPPTKSKISLVDIDSYYVESDDITTIKKTASGSFIHKLESKVYAFSTMQSSIYSLAKSFSLGNIIYFWAEFEFGVKDGFSSIFSQFKNIQFKMEFNLLEVAS